MESCTCGVARRKFWVWRDANETMHASGFKPSSGMVAEVIAATARDALLAVTGQRMPKHQVTSTDGSGTIWEGRCSEVMTPAAN